VLSYVIAGLALGGVYAISAAGLVVTYKSAAILNFGFGAMAYFVARLYYYLNTQHGWSVGAAGVVAILIAGPAIGAFLYLVLFRFLRLSSPLVKIVVTLGLQVMVPPISDLAFGNVVIFQAPGLAPVPVRTFEVFGAPVSMDQIIIYGCVLVIVVGGGLILRYTEAGLRVRAMVDSPAMTTLSGSSPTAISLGVWAVSGFLAGLAGVLTAPILGLDAANFNLLMAAAFAAVVAAQLKNLPVAVLVGLAMGIAGSLVQRYLPPDSTWSSVVVPSIPFAFTAIFLIYQVIRRGRSDEAAGVGGALDRAISVQEDLVTVGSKREVSRKVGRIGFGWPLVGFAIVLILPLILHGFWVGLLGLGVCYGVTFLAYSLVIGEGGMVWLCIISFAGVGAITAGQLSGVHGWPVLASIVVGGLIALPMGLILGSLTIRLGNLYVALVTLTFGLLMENLVFTRPVFLQQNLGVSITRPSFAASDKAFTYFALIIFAVVAVFIVNLRRSTTGMALTAVRSSEAGAKTTGISVFRMKVAVGGLGAFVAGVGGALYAVDRQVALPTDFATIGGALWLAVLVTQGIRSNMAALVAGLSLTIMPAIFQTYLPSKYGEIPQILFGLGAIAVARNPDGVLAMQARQFNGLVSRLRPPRPVSVVAPVPADAATPSVSAKAGQ
jgi:branched-chain amino acid transport system permease protein